MSTAESLIKTLKSAFPTVTKLGGHREYKPGTECPGGELYKKLPGIAILGRLVFARRWTSLPIILAEQELVENFIHRLREQIEDARQQLAFLNNTLANLRFGGERFEFITQPSPQVRQVYDMIMDSQQVMGGSLFDSDFRQKHQQGWDLLFERLTRHDDENIELRELQDYRNYLQYDIRIHYPNGDRAILSQINAKKSGGETTTPFYVAMAASFAQAYRLNQPRPSDTIRLALFDEAFGKMDTARTASALQFMREAGLQVLLATPPDKSGSLLPYVDSVCTVVAKTIIRL
ncbi:MAG: SbcC/MukB-like Walker B domain-containing protein [Candidatus Competibacteraceae bacterium]|nr:SbcC/MukB-like Walker B domain-containing protein [Candidatus Competibacteraceae bacterium]